MPTDGIVLPKGEKKEINILENDKIKIFLRAIIENRYGLAFLMALFTGMRRGEILALTWGDIDFENKIINVNKTLNVIKCFDNDKIEYRTIINSSKTVNSNRVLPILPILITPLKTHYTRSQIHGWGSVYDFVFTNKFGKNVNPRKFSQYFYDIFKKSEIKRINFHALRHTFASMAIDKGVNPKTLSNILGHSSISFTLDTYCHVTIQQKQREISKIDDFENILGYEKGYKPKNETLQILETRSAPSGTRTQDPLIKSHKIQASDPL